VADNLINSTVRLHLGFEKRRTALFAMKITFGLCPAAKAAKAAERFPMRVERRLPVGCGRKTESARAGDG
jgi:hypothetical protein